MLAAIAEGKNFRQSNTEVIQNADGCSVYLFGYEIARINSKTGERLYSNAGWRTSTTKSRLNALGAGITQKAFEWYTPAGEVFRNAF